MQTYNGISFCTLNNFSKYLVVLEGYSQQIHRRDFMFESFRSSRSFDGTNIRQSLTRDLELLGIKNNKRYFRYDGGLNTFVYVITLI